jgi:hypothetical protein
MKKLILGIIFLSFSFMQAQVNFENGYYTKYILKRA